MNEYDSLKEQRGCICCCSLITMIFYIRIHIVIAQYWINPMQWRANGFGTWNFTLVCETLRISPIDRQNLEDNKVICMKRLSSFHTIEQYACQIAFLHQILQHWTILLKENQLATFVLTWNARFIEERKSCLGVRRHDPAILYANGFLVIHEWQTFSVHTLLFEVRIFVVMMMISISPNAINHSLPNLLLWASK